MGIIIKTIKTADRYYVYDRSQNSIILLKKDEYEELKKIEKGQLPEAESGIVAKMKRQGYFEDNSLEIVEHPYTCYLSHILDKHLEQVTLQVTQRCNLRCKYCTYAGIYDNHNRSHADYDMDWETAKKALDFYLLRSAETEKLDIGFYGGEPLLKMDLIKKCVAYVNSCVQSKKVTYSMTTNGTLLTPEIAQFLFENNFSLTISLDGSREEQNRYRVFSNGTGSFDVIMKNLAAIKKMFPENFKDIMFNAVLNPDNDYKHLKLYFEEDQIVGGSDIMTAIVDNYSTEDVNFSNEFYRARAFDLFKLYLYMIKKLDVSEVSKLVLAHSAEIRQQYQQLHHHNRLGYKAHHSGPCVPGGKRLFVNVFGELFPCEKVGEQSNVMKIGTLDNGFDYQMANRLLNIGKLTENECKKCWALAFCGQCCQCADEGSYLSKGKKLQHCSGSRNNAYDDIAEICVLAELGCTFSTEEGKELYEKLGLSPEL